MVTTIFKYMKWTGVFMLLLVAIGLCSCDPNAKAYTKRIEIDINV